MERRKRESARPAERQQKNHTPDNFDDLPVPSQESVGQSREAYLARVIWFLVFCAFVATGRAQQMFHLLTVGHQQPPPVTEPPPVAETEQPIVLPPVEVIPKPLPQNNHITDPLPAITLQPAKQEQLGDIISSSTVSKQKRSQSVDPLDASMSEQKEPLLAELLLPSASVKDLHRQMQWSGLYPCHDYGEVFGASFLVTMDYLRPMRNYRFAMKSHRAAHASHYVAWKANATVFKTVDALDFFVEHMSVYERRLNLGLLKSMRTQKNLREAITEMLANRLRAYSLYHFRGTALRQQSYTASYHQQQYQQTLVHPSKQDGEDRGVLALVPYYGEGFGKGQAQSSLDTRKAYLEATYWSLRAITSRVLIVVCSVEDELYLLEFVKDLNSHMDSTDSIPIMTIVRITIPVPQALPVGAIGFAHRCMFHDGEPRNSDWNVTEVWSSSEGSPQYFCHDSHLSSSRHRWKDLQEVAEAGRGAMGGVKYFLFTEADQIVHARSLLKLLDGAIDELRAVVPHRFIPMPTPQDFEGTRAAELLQEIRRAKHVAYKEQAFKTKEDANAARQQLNFVVDERFRAGGEAFPAFTTLPDVLDVTGGKEQVPVHVHPMASFSSPQQQQQQQQQQLDGGGVTTPVNRGAVHSCCMDRGNCTDRSHWNVYHNSAVKLLRVVPHAGSVRGLAFVNGEGNVQQSPPVIRICNVMPYGACP